MAQAHGDPGSLLEPLRRLAYSVDPDVAPAETVTLRQVIRNRFYVVRAGAALMGAFGLVGLLLAMVGLYGVTSYVVSRRTREVGVRVALGADSGMILRMVLREGMALVAAGIAVGIVLALGAARVVSSMLFGVGAVRSRDVRGGAVSPDPDRARRLLPPRSASGSRVPDDRAAELVKQFAFALKRLLLRPYETFPGVYPGSWTGPLRGRSIRLLQPQESGGGQRCGKAPTSSALSLSSSRSSPSPAKRPARASLRRRGAVTRSSSQPGSPSRVSASGWTIAIPRKVAPPRQEQLFAR